MDLPVRVGLDLTATQRARMTGWERFALELEEALGRVKSDDVEVVPLRREGGPAGRVATHTYQLDWQLRRLQRLRRILSLDVLHAPTFPPARFGGATVWTVHDDLILGGHRRYARRGARLWVPLARRASRHADVVVTDTRAGADDLARMGVPRTRLRVIMPGVPRFAPDGAPPKLRHVASGGVVDPPPDFVLAVGTIEPRKRPGDAAGAAAMAHLPIVFVGRVDPATRDRTFLSHEHVYRCAGIEDAELAWLYRRSRAVLALSAYEGLDLPLLEARSFGCRIVASDTPVHREVGGPSISYVPVADVAAAASAIAQATPADDVQLPTWDDCARGYLDIYRESAKAIR